MFPPIVDAGAFRPLAFARYLPEFGYDTTVLSRPDFANFPLDPAQLATLPASTHIERLTLGFEDSWKEHFRRRFRWLSPVERLMGRPAGSVADALAWRVARRHEHRPWEIGWMEPAVEAGLKLIAAHRPDAIIATAPPYESLKAGCLLHERTGVPLIVDYRDPWTFGQPWIVRSEQHLRDELKWEARVMREASRAIVVTPSMQRTMREMYPDRSDDIRLIMNGYEDFPDSGVSPPASPLTISYVGTVMDRRLPKVFYDALRTLRDKHPAIAADLRIRLVGPNQCPYSVEDRLRAEGVDSIVTFAGPVGHQQSRDAMRTSHALLHIEPVAGYAVSSKMFEYLRAERPIIAMVLSGSDDELFLQKSGAGENVGLESPDGLVGALIRTWERWRKDDLRIAVDMTWLKQFQRREQVGELAKLLDEVVN